MLSPSQYRFGRSRVLSFGVLLVICGATSSHAVVPRKPTPTNTPATPKRVIEAKADESTKPDHPEGPAPQVELFVPSTERLGRATARSHLAKICEAITGTIELPTSGGGEQFDLGAVFQVVREIRSWPDTSLAVAVYSQDKEGRPRWAIQTAWPLEQLVGRVRTILNMESSKKILANIELLKRDDGTYSLELPDTKLAVLREFDDGSLIASSDSVEIPRKLIGRKTGDVASEAQSLIYCRVNLAAADDEGNASFLSQMLGIRNLRYVASTTDSGDWTERITLNWNPAAGWVLKSAIKRVKKQFDCPTDAFVAAAVHVDMGGSLADGLADLPGETTSAFMHGEMAVTVAPGSGFFPVPDIFYQFVLKNEKKAVDAIRKYVIEDREKRAEDDLEPVWHEIKTGTSPIFWRDPAADGAAGMSFAHFRTVIFFEAGDAEKKTENRMIVAETSSFAEDAVRQWRKLCRSQTIRLPDNADAHWQARVSWRRIYAQFEPYIGLATAFGEDTKPLPSAETLADALTDANINFRIELSGLRATHTGPIPIGMFLVPSVVSEAITSRSKPSSESEREQLACRNLRVLYHHAKLFKKDYGRWPATVAELDGYVDFNEHRNLLWLPEQERGLVAGIVKAAIGSRELPQADREKVDDAIYEIDWTPTDWQIRFRDGEFRDYKTIFIDADGEIHRLPKANPKDKTKEKSAGGVKTAGTN